jgi:hypothetical protein
MKKLAYTVFKFVTQLHWILAISSIAYTFTDHPFKAWICLSFLIFITGCDMISSAIYGKREINMILDDLKNTVNSIKEEN